MCALCHGIVLIILKLDNKKNFKFSPLSLRKINQKYFSDSIILNFNNNLYYEGQAIIKILENLNFFGRVLSLFCKLISLKILNYFYRIIAENRNIWVRKERVPFNT
tara:strand:+ start:1307 stop:1624 length:318 start_codon:yes stop_codon:yes gene_type:complete